MSSLWYWALSVLLSALLPRLERSHTNSSVSRPTFTPGTVLRYFLPFSDSTESSEVRHHYDITDEKFRFKEVEIFPQIQKNNEVPDSGFESRTNYKVHVLTNEFASLWIPKTVALGLPRKKCLTSNLETRVLSWSSGWPPWCSMARCIVRGGEKRVGFSLYWQAVHIICNPPYLRSSLHNPRIKCLTLCLTTHMVKHDS